MAATVKTTPILSATEPNNNEPIAAGQGQPDKSRQNTELAVKCSVHAQPSEHYPRFQLRPDLNLDVDQVLASIARVRQRVLKLHDDDPTRFSHKQLERMRAVDFEVRRFLFQSDMNESQAEQMLVEKLEYGRTLDYDNAHDLRFPREFYEIGGVFEYAPDADGAPLLYFRAKLHRKVPVLTESVKKFLLYQMIRIDLRYNTERRWAIVFDMQDTGFSNVDIDLLLFLVKAVRCYYPWAIRYIAVVDVPWILRGVWKAIEKLMPDNGRRLIHLMDRKRLRQIVSNENLPDFMGGTCKRSYCSVPEGALPAEEIGGKELGLTVQQVRELRTHFEAFLPKKVATKSK
jgi:hypothetical protein